MTILQSKWGSLSPSLIAAIYPVQRAAGTQGTRSIDWERASNDNGGDTEVAFPITDSTLEASLNWTSPFEAIGAEGKLPLLSGLIQSGALASVSSALLDLVPSDFGPTGFTAGDFAKFANDGIKSLEGRSGITKLNSTQIFSGMQPLKFSLTAHFRAWDDPRSEVEAPVNQLMAWALPAELSSAGFIDTFRQTSDPIRALFPSRIPTILGFRYASTSILPIVIESISQPIVAPRDINGARISVAVPIQFSTLAAVDRSEYKAYGVR